MSPPETTPFASVFDDCRFQVDLNDRILTGKWPSDISFKQKSRQIVSGNGLSKNNKWLAQKCENGGAFTPCRMNEKYKLGGNDLFLHISQMTYQNVLQITAVFPVPLYHSGEKHYATCVVYRFTNTWLLWTNSFFELMIQQTTHKLTCLKKFNESFWRIRHWVKTTESTYDSLNCRFRVSKSETDIWLLHHVGNKIHVLLYMFLGSHITLQPKTGCPLKLSRAEPGQYLDGRPPGKN